MIERTVMQSVAQGHVLTILPEASSYEAACAMTKARCGSVLIVDGAGAMLGILTERDLMTKLVAQGRNPDTTPVQDIMTHNPQFVGPETTVSDAVLIMKRHNFRHLPIVSAARILGVFSLRDAMPRELVEAEHMADLIDQQSTNVLS
ncbi:MAG: CBS domain-containing protein [Pseudomonadota bacterium]|nr:CBS domain-containing protein [Pseudomonadota bacterium]